MSFKTVACSKCGNLFSYDDSFGSKKPQTDGLFGGYLCSNCSNQIHNEKTQDDFRRQEQKLFRQRQEEIEYNQSVEEQRQKERYWESIRQQKEAQNKFENPGEYECPNCLFITLKRNASRCPKCQGTISQNYWAAIYKKEAQEKEKRRLAAEEWESTRPEREAAERMEKTRKLKRKILIIISSILGPFIIAGLIAVMNGHAFVDGISVIFSIIGYIILIAIIILLLGLFS